MEVIKLKAKRPGKLQLDTNSMSIKTKDFIQKICYQGTASVDMTQYGFIADSKIRPISLMLRPLTEKLKTICGRYGRSSKRSSVNTSRATEPIKKLQSRPLENSRKIKNFSPVLTSRPRGVVTFAKTKVYSA
ncbi:hypothetical protein MSG28_014665 [Choristoneura fumiferana]|uniref:Uncharacterized protein n=1 Tax=Choristoneura fumiferana TaxID=7141 RepID=A0ACC0JS95_CHOFU|nr:hypothetical protein MSG28_014665 [Choristoneura fumiferana]